MGSERCARIDKEGKTLAETKNLAPDTKGKGGKECSNQQLSREQSIIVWGWYGGGGRKWAMGSSLWKPEEKNKPKKQGGGVYGAANEPFVD